MLEQLGQQVSDVINGLLGPIVGFLEGYVWNWPPQAPLLAVVLLGTGLFITLRLLFVQVRGFKHAIDITLGRYDDPDDAGDLQHFQALTTALSATVGIGNIAGVAIAIRMGGPGALAWMWVTAFFGMALKFTECTLAVKHRVVHEDGSVSGGPMYYIEKGLGWKWMATAFAALAAICSFGTGNMNQANTMADQVESYFGIAPIWTAFVAATVVGMVIIGGIRRIGRVTSILAPSMAALYVGGALVILVRNFSEVPAAFTTIIEQAINPTSLAGGAAGSFLMTLMWGVRRGLFSNEAGQGSAPIAHATAKTDEPVREGLVASLEPFIDTLVICTMTGLVIVTTGVFKEKVDQTLTLGEVEAVFAAEPADGDLQRLWEERSEGPETRTVVVTDGVAQDAGFAMLSGVVEDLTLVDGNGAPWSGQLSVARDGTVTALGDEPSVRGRAFLNGAPMTAAAFARGLPGNSGDLIVTLSVLLFAISTAISWSYYGDRATEYLFGSGAIPIYRWIYVGFFFMGCLLPLSTVWTFGDVALGLMSFPNLISLILLSGSVRLMSREYFSHKQERSR